MSHAAREKGRSNLRYVSATTPSMVAEVSRGVPVIFRSNGMYILAALLLIVQFAVFHDYIFLQKLYLFLDIGSDSYNIYYPSLVHDARYLRTDGIPTWSFYKGMGEAVFPGGIQNPLNLFLYMLGPDRLGYGIIFVELTKSMLTGLLFYAYFGLLGLSPVTRIISGIAAAFFGYLILGSSGWYGHSLNVMFFALLLVAFELFYVRKNWLLFPLVIFFIASNPFRLYLYGLFLFFYAVMRMVGDHELDFRQSILFLGRLAGAGILGLGLSLPFFYGSLIDMINSPRVSGDVKAVEQLASLAVFSFSDRLQAVTALMRLFSNDLLGVGSDYSGWYNYLEAPVFYAGLIPLLLAPGAFCYLDRRKRFAYGIFCLIWIIPVVFPYFRHALYAFMGNYYKHGLSMFIPFVVLLSGAYGLENLMIRKNLRWFPVLLAATLGTLLVVLFFPYFADMPQAGKGIIRTDIRWLVAGFLVVHALILFGLHHVRFRPMAVPILVLLACVEAGAFSYVTVNHRQALTRQQFEAPVGYNDRTLDAVAYLKKTDHGFYRINKDFSSSLAEVNSLNDAMVQGYFGTPSYSSFNRQEYIDFLRITEVIAPGRESETRWAVGLLQRPFLQAVFAVQYNLLKTHDYKSRDSAYKLIYSPVKHFGDVEILKNNFFLPLGFTCDAFMHETDYMALSRTHKDMALFEAVVTDHDLPGLQRITSEEMAARLKTYRLNTFLENVARKRDSAMRLTEFRQDRIKGEITLEQTALVFFAVPTDPGWRALVNGESHPLIRANIGFMGIVLEKGHHDIVLEYSVPYIKLISFIALACLVLYGVLAVRQRMVISRISEAANRKAVQSA
jgi:uncharacterized membrane protein YfhO